ncbi:hypothetical protein ES703_02273 [subsurface metagenome]
MKILRGIYELKKRQVKARIYTHNVGVEGSAVSECYLYCGCIGNNVCIGYDFAVIRYYES